MTIGMTCILEDQVCPRSPFSHTLVPLFILLLEPAGLDQPIRHALNHKLHGVAAFRASDTHKGNVYISLPLLIDFNQDTGH
jgi:hypothetical protein